MLQIESILAAALSRLCRLGYEKKIFQEKCGMIDNNCAAREASKIAGPGDSLAQACATSGTGSDSGTVHFAFP